LRTIEPSFQGDVVAIVLRGARVPAAEEDERARVALPDGLTRIVTGLGGDVTPRMGVLVGVELWRSSSEVKGYGSVAASYGPQMLPPQVLREREIAADALLAKRSAAIPFSAEPRTYLAMAGMGDGFLVLGTCGGARIAAPFTFRTHSIAGAHDRKVGGVLLAHASWDEASIVKLDLSAKALTAACSEVDSLAMAPQLVLAAHHDSRS
jgi:hypothetical protein